MTEVLNPDLREPPKPRPLKVVEEYEEKIIYVDSDGEEEEVQVEDVQEEEAQEEEAQE